MWGNLRGYPDGHHLEKVIIGVDLKLVNCRPNLIYAYMFVYLFVSFFLPYIEYKRMK